MSDLSRTIRPTEKHLLCGAAIAALLLSVLAAGGLGFAAASTSPQLFNVQLFATPTNSSLDYFYMMAYNSTGSMVAQSQSQYPAFGLELPQGTYLFTVSAVMQGYYGGPMPLASNVQSAIPIRVNYPASEYGYVLAKVTGPTTLQVHTSDITKVGTTNVSVQVDFANGTGAANVDVYASVVGAMYWYYPVSDLKMYAQTDSSGHATLNVPSLPVEVYAWDWIPVNLPKNITTVQTSIGGEPVNVTVYWQPTYVGLAGSTLVIPPSTQASITLHVQKPDYWAVSVTNGVASPTIVQGSASSSPAAVPAPIATQYSSTFGGQYQVNPSPTSIPSLPVSNSTAQGNSSLDLILGAGIGVAFALAAASLFLVLRKH